MKFIAPLGWAVMLFFLGVFIAGYGSHWTFGKYLTPKSLVSPDGVTYLDGSPIELVSLALVRSGIEEEVYLVCGLVLIGLFVLVVRRMMHLHWLGTALADQKLRERYGLPPRSYL